MAETLLAGALLLVLLLLPGYLVLRSLLVLRLQALGGAPAVLAFLLGGLAVVMHEAHVPWTLRNVALGLVVVTALGVLVGRIVTRRTRARLAASGAARPPRPWWPLLAALLAAAVIAGWAIYRGMKEIATPLQASDGVFHLNAVAYLRRGQDAFPIGAFPEMYWGSVHFYPSGWHSLVAILPTSVSAAANLTVIAGLAVVWPLGMASVLGASFSPASRRVRDGLPLLVGTLASVFATAPVVMMTTLWPYGWSVCLLPGVLGLVMVMRPSSVEVPRRASASRAGGLLAALLAVLGVVYVHGTAAFNLALIAVPTLVIVGWRWLRHRWAAGGRSRSTVLLIVGLVLLVLVVGLLGFQDQLNMLAGYWRKTGDVKGLVIGMLRDDDMINLIPYGGDGALWLTVLALLGIVPAMRRHRNRWAVLAVVLVVIVFLGTVWTSTPVGLLASPWYKQQARILPVLEIPVLVLAMTGLEAARLRLATAGSLTGLRRPVIAVLAALLAVAYTVVPVIIAVQRTVEHWRITAYAYQSDKLVWPVMLSTGEAQFLESSAKKLPAGAVVLGEPTNGSAYYWSLTGTDVVYPSLRPNSEKLRSYVAANTAWLGTDPQVCRDLDSLGAHYYYTDTDRTGDGAPGGAALPKWQNELSQVPRSELTLVASDGTRSLWLISGCGWVR